MSKEMTVARIERGYRISMGFVWAFRVLSVAWTAFIIWALFEFDGYGVFWMYLVMGPIWWATTIFWRQTAVSVRKTQYSSLRIWGE